MTVKLEYRPLVPLPFPASCSSSRSAAALHKYLELDEQMGDLPPFSSPLNLPAASFLSLSSSSNSVFDRLPELYPTQTGPSLSPRHLLSPPHLQASLSASSPQPLDAASLASDSTLVSHSTVASYASTSVVASPDLLSAAIDEVGHGEPILAPSPPTRDSSIFSSSSSSSSASSSALSTPRDGHSSPVDQPSAFISALRPKRRRPLTTELRHSIVKLEEGVEEEEEDEQESEEEEERHRKHRAAVIDQTVHRARELYGLVGLLTRACNRQNEHIRVLTQQLQATTAQLQAASHSTSTSNSTQPADDTIICSAQSQSSSQAVASPTAPASSSNPDLVDSSGLTSSLLLSVRVSIALHDATTARVLDCNAYMLQTTGWERHHVIGRIMQRTYDEYMDDRVWQANEPMRRLAGDHVLVNGPNGTMVRAVLQEQYPASLEKKRALYRGEMERVRALWRNQMRDGVVYETSAMSYVADWKDVDDGQGGVVRRPNRVVCVCSMFDARRVDDDDMRVESEPSV